jgi:hypothetical protein
LSVQYDDLDRTRRACILQDLITDRESVMNRELAVLDVQEQQDGVDAVAGTRHWREEQKYSHLTKDDTIICVSREPGSPKALTRANYLRLVHAMEFATADHSFQPKFGIDIVAKTASQHGIHILLLDASVSAK